MSTAHIDKTGHSGPVLYVLQNDTGDTGVIQRNRSSGDWILIQHIIPMKRKQSKCNNGFSYSHDACQLDDMIVCFMAEWLLRWNDRVTILSNDKRILSSVNVTDKTVPPAFKISFYGKAREYIPATLITQEGLLSYSQLVKDNNLLQGAILRNHSSASHSDSFDSISESSTSKPSSPSLTYSEPSIVPAAPSLMLPKSPSLYTSHLEASTPYNPDSVSSPSSQSSSSLASDESQLPHTEALSNDEKMQLTLMSMEAANKAILNKEFTAYCSEKNSNNRSYWFMLELFKLYASRFSMPTPARSICLASRAPNVRAAIELSLMKGNLYKSFPNVIKQDTYVILASIAGIRSRQEWIQELAVAEKAIQSASHDLEQEKILKEGLNVIKLPTSLHDEEWKRVRNFRQDCVAFLKKRFPTFDAEYFTTGAGSRLYEHVAL